MQPRKLLAFQFSIIGRSLWLIYVKTDMNLDAKKMRAYWSLERISLGLVNLVLQWGWDRTSQVRSGDQKTLHSYKYTHCPLEICSKTLYRYQIPWIIKSGVREMNLEFAFRHIQRVSDASQGLPGRTKRHLQSANNHKCLSEAYRRPSSSGVDICVYLYLWMPSPQIWRPHCI